MRNLLNFEVSNDEKEKQRRATTENEENIYSGSKRSLTRREISGISISLLNTALDIMPLALENIAYNLAMNPQAQKTLCEEVDRVLSDNVSFLIQI